MQKKKKHCLKVSIILNKKFMKHLLILNNIIFNNLAALNLFCLRLRVGKSGEKQMVVQVRVMVAHDLI